MKKTLTVAEMLELSDDYRLELKLLSGDRGLRRIILETRIEEPGLGLAGFTEHILPGSILAFTSTELSYLSTLSEADHQKALNNLFEVDAAAMVIIEGRAPSSNMIEAADKDQMPVLSTTLPIDDFLNRAKNFLDDMLAPNVSIHGVLIDIFGMGILILGHAGIGKSECALELILRGHRFVADDIVEVQRIPPQNLYGAGAELIKYHMEIRGLGIINIKSLFGISSIRDRKKIQLVTELVDWDPNKEYDRLGFDEMRYTVLDVELPLLQIPVRPGRNIAAIIEVAARNHLLKLMGYDSALEFEQRLTERMAEGRPPVQFYGDDVE